VYISVDAPTPVYTRHGSACARLVMCGFALSRNTQSGRWTSIGIGARLCATCLHPRYSSTSLWEVFLPAQRVCARHNGFSLHLRFYAPSPPVYTTVCAPVSGRHVVWFLGSTRLLRRGNIHTQHKIIVKTRPVLILWVTSSSLA